MIYSVYTASRTALEIALAELKIDYETKDSSCGDKWGSHKFNKRYEASIISYFTKKNQVINFVGHSVWLPHCQK